MKYILLIVALSATFFGCSKDSPNDGESSKMIALTTGSWKLTGLLRDYDKDGTYEEDTYAILADCDKDDIITFQVGGTLITDEGPTKCWETKPQSSTSTWSLSKNESHLQWGSSDNEIEALSTSTLKLKATISYNVIYTINQKLTYSKQ